VTVPPGACWLTTIGAWGSPARTGVDEIPAAVLNNSNVAFAYWHDTASARGAMLGT